MAYLTLGRLRLGQLLPQDVAEAASIDDLRIRFNKKLKHFGYRNKIFIAASGSAFPYNVHPVGTDLPEEGAALLSSYLFFTNYPLLSGKDFSDVAENYQDLARQAYKFFRTALQAIKYISELSGSRFVLKSPYHSGFAEANT